MKEALFYKKTENKTVECLLCPQFCKIKNNKTGFCKVRTNKNGKLYSDNYGLLCSVAFDPIEKKPLYHYFPSSNIMSIGSVGCNLHCKFCQNWEISQTSVSKYSYMEKYSISDIIFASQKKQNNIGIAYTYNEPTVFYEFMIELAEAAYKVGLKNIMVSNGFINEKPLSELLKYIDAFSIDLKAYTESFYKNYTSSNLEPVKNTLKQIRKAGKHIEITNLIIPTLNDNIEKFTEMIDWITHELGKDTILHLSRYFPRYKTNIEKTPSATIHKLYKIAKSKLNYVFIGNMHSDEGQNTVCINCNKTIIVRNGYYTSTQGIDKQGKCIYCNTKVKDLTKN